MKNVRFAMSIHLMVLMAHHQKQFLSSDYIAGSINVNPVLVRKELSHLKQAGFIESREGKHGGSRMVDNPDTITLSAIYKALRKEGEQIFGFPNQAPNPNCPVGANIKNELNGIYEEVDKGIEERLSKITIGALARKVLAE